MERKTFVYKLLDGNEYVFSERNREDVNYIAYQNKIRAERVRFIQDNITDETDRLALLRLEMDKIYSDVDIGLYIISNKDAIIDLVYASFKVKNPNLTLNDFKKLVNEKIIKELSELLNELEKPEELYDEVVTEAIGITQSKLAEWAKQQPRLYKWLKQVGNLTIKKKEIAYPEK